MMIAVAKFRAIVGALAFLLMVSAGQSASAQQPSSVNPQASAVKEAQLFQELNRISGRCTLPDQKACTIEQPAGRDWRHFHEVTLRWIGGFVIIGILAALVVFYLWRGMVRIESRRSGRTIVRFNGFERFVHWTTATCFIILALSGLNITFGKPLLLPLVGPESFTTGGASAIAASFAASRTSPASTRSAASSSSGGRGSDPGPHAIARSAPSTAGIASAREGFRPICVISVHNARPMLELRHCGS